MSKNCDVPRERKPCFGNILFCLNYYVFYMQDEEVICTSFIWLSISGKNDRGNPRYTDKEREIVYKADIASFLLYMLNK